MNRCDCPTELDEAKLQAHLPSCSPRDRLLITLGFETGLRLSELLGLTVGHVWRDGRPTSILRLARSGLKGGRGKWARSVASRAIPLNARAREEVRAYMSAVSAAEAAAPLFPSREGPGPLSRRQASRAIARIFRAAGLDPSRVWAGHSLRRRFVTRIYEQTHDINLARAAVGHRWVTTTQAYAGLDDACVEQAILTLGEDAGARGDAAAMSSCAALRR
jgi:site-specific recombinase XerD